MFAPTREIGSRWSEVEFPANVGSRGITGRTLDRFDQCGIRRTHVLRAERPAAIRSAAATTTGLIATVCNWNRPIAQGLEAAAGHLKDLLASAALIARGFKVILDRGQGIGELVHLFGGRHAPMADQLDFDETHDATHQFGRGAEIEHAQGARNLLQQAWNLFDALVIPR